MTPALALFGYAVLLTTVGSRLLSAAQWVERAPRLGIAAWQVLSGSVVLAAVLGAAALAVPTAQLGTGLAELLRACALALRAQYATPGGALVSAIGVVLAVGIVGRVVFCLARELTVASRRRRSHVDALALIGRRVCDLDAVVVDHDTAAAYCLPGRRSRIVLTSGAIAALDADQLDAVLAHERAHLHGRHHLVIAAATGLRRAFPFVACFDRASAAQVRLVEMLADDQAGRRCPRLAIATALVALADGSAPVAALPAGGPTALARVRRLAAPARPLGALRTLLVGLFLLAVLAVPVAVAAAPAMAAARANSCPVELAPS